MEIQGVIIKVLPEKSGEGKNGTWVSRSWVLETQEQYPQKICFEAFNKHFAINEGDDVTVSINIKSQEWEEKWYTKIDAWKVVFNNKAEAAPPPPPDNAASDTQTDDLPF